MEYMIESQCRVVIIRLINLMLKRVWTFKVHA